jgi:glycosyltransferase involved in cell wall biosynthesis
MMADNRIRVLQIITRLISGGADENTVATVVGLDKSRYHVDLVIGDQSDEEHRFDVAPCRVYLLPELRRDIHPINDLLALLKLYRLVWRNRYHVIHTHTAKAGIIGRLAGVLSRTPVIVHTLHGSTFHDNLLPIQKWLYCLLERIAAKKTHKIISVGDDLKERYLAAGVGCRRQYVTIRSGFDLDLFRLSDHEIEQKRKRVRRSLGFSDADIIVGSASRLEPRKGQKYLLDAVADVVTSHPQLKVIIAGDGEDKQELRRYATSLGMNGNIHFLGYRTDIADVISAMDVFVLSSLWEGLPRVLVQSAALGRPIITFDIEGARELVSHGVNGFVVPVRDVKSLAEKILYLVADPARAQHIGRAGRLKVTREWDQAVMVRRIDCLYSELIDGR